MEILPSCGCVSCTFNNEGYVKRKILPIKKEFPFLVWKYWHLPKADKIKEPNPMATALSFSVWVLKKKKKKKN